MIVNKDNTLKSYNDKYNQNQYYLCKMGAGITNGEAMNKLYKTGFQYGLHNLSFSGGLCVGTGLTGFSGGGGMGFASKQYGLTADNIMGIDFLYINKQNKVILASCLPDEFIGMEHLGFLQSWNGSGNGNFGIIVSQYVRTYNFPDVCKTIVWDPYNEKHNCPENLQILKKDPICWLNSLWKVWARWTSESNIRINDKNGGFSTGLDIGRNTNQWNQPGPKKPVFNYKPHDVIDCPTNRKNYQLEINLTFVYLGYLKDDLWFDYFIDFWNRLNMELGIQCPLTQDIKKKLYKQVME